MHRQRKEHFTFEAEETNSIHKSSSVWARTKISRSEVPVGCWAGTVGKDNESDANPSQNLVSKPPLQEQKANWTGIWANEPSMGAVREQQGATSTTAKQSIYLDFSGIQRASLELGPEQSPKHVSQLETTKIFFCGF